MRQRGGEHLCQPNAVWAERGFRGLPAGYAARPGAAGACRRRPGMDADARSDLPARLPDLGNGGRGHQTAGGGDAAGAFPRRGYGGGQAVQRRAAAQGVFWPEGCAAGSRHPPDDARPGFSGRDRGLPDRARGGWAGNVQPQHLPGCSAAPGGHGAVPGAERGAGGLRAGRA